MIKCMPLVWPSGRDRKSEAQRQDHKFGRRGDFGIQSLNFGEAVERVADEIRLIGATSGVITSVVGTKGFSKFFSFDPGVALYFSINDRRICLACDTYKHPIGNAAAIAAHIKSLRAIERYGVGTMGQMLEGFAALPDQQSGG